MMQIAAYGRLGQPPREIQTASGKTMAVGSIAVTLVDRSGGEVTQWIGIVGFGRVAETLLKHDKGELVSVSGRVQANTYQERVELQIVADIIVSARSARPGGGRRKSGQRTAESPREQSEHDGVPFDDPLPEGF